MTNRVFISAERNSKSAGHDRRGSCRRLGPLGGQRRKAIQRANERADHVALLRADIIVTDCWPKGGSKETLLQFQINARLLDETKKGCVFIPCPPVTRGEEVSLDAMNHRSCVSFNAKAFLMHAQNALVEAAVLTRCP